MKMEQEVKEYQMTTILMAQPIERVVQQCFSFDPIAELKRYAWHPEMNVITAEKALFKKPAYTYITRFRETERGFEISFVNLNGDIEHHYFTLVDAKHGIWRNSAPEHIGSLGKVICDMMECSILDCKPLN